ncbi:MAG TPA: hypothetical protein VKL19_01150 [Thermoanaerobaculia bacterium]|nr:hypothetical protein [Thermoanaerobaculia bacterium]
MISQLLPQRIDNTYRGHKLALWLLSLLLFMRVVMSLNVIFNSYVTLSTADGVPLETYTPAAARTAVSLFALLGLSNLMICLVGILALVRYRSMVPLMFALLLLQQVSARLINLLMPIVRTGTPPGFYINLGLLALMIVGLALSLHTRGDLRIEAATG